MTDTDPLNYTQYDLDVGARTMFGECRGEPHCGQVAVAWVIRNRMETGYRGKHSVADVCRDPWQFSCWNESDPQRALLLRLKQTDPTYVRLRDVLQGVLLGIWDDPTGGARHYHTVAMGFPKAWGKPVPPSAIIGAHAFYSKVK